MSSRSRLALFGASGALALIAGPPSASAFNPLKPLCSVAGAVSGIAGKACSVAQNGGRLLSAGKKLVTGHIGSAVKTVLGSGTRSVASKATTALAFSAIVVAALGGAKFVLHETGQVLGSTTAPQLRSTWFSSMYWRVAAIAAVLTLPFLFAAAVQSLVRSDVSLLLRAAFGYLPLAMLAVGIAAPLAMLLLAASDQMAAIVSSAAGDASAHFLARASRAMLVASAFGSPFVALFVALTAIAGGLVLWLELLIRAAAVYVVVLMLPLAFAAFVWPARRVWAVRAVELLVALILSKFAIVAVLALGGAALGASESHSITGVLGGVVLLLMGAFAPWALLRLIPLAEIASGAASSLSGGTGTAAGMIRRADAAAHERDWTARTAEMRREAEASERAPGEGREAEASKQAPDAEQSAARSETLNGHVADGEPEPPAPAPSANGNGPRAAANGGTIEHEAPASAGGGGPIAERDAEPAAPARANVPFLELPPRDEHGPPSILLLDEESTDDRLRTDDRPRTEARPRTDAPADDPDPTPPAQPPENGRL